MAEDGKKSFYQEWEEIIKGQNEKSQSVCAPTTVPKVVDTTKPCPKCGGEIRCSNCNAYEDDCHDLNLQCTVCVLMWTTLGKRMGTGYCSEFWCKCGYEEKVK